MDLIWNAVGYLEEQPKMKLNLRDKENVYLIRAKKDACVLQIVDKLYDLAYDYERDLEYQVLKKLIIDGVIGIQRAYRNYKVYQAYQLRIFGFGVPSKPRPHARAIPTTPVQMEPPPKPSKFHCLMCNYYKDLNSSALHRLHGWRDTLLIWDFYCYECKVYTVVFNLNHDGINIDNDLEENNIIGTERCNDLFRPLYDYVVVPWRRRHPTRSWCAFVASMTPREWIDYILRTGFTDFISEHKRFPWHELGEFAPTQFIQRNWRTVRKRRLQRCLQRVFETNYVPRCISTYVYSFLWLTTTTMATNSMI
jgi:hypothetical protein